MEPKLLPWITCNLLFAILHFASCISHQPNRNKDSLKEFYISNPSDTEKIKVEKYFEVIGVCQLELQNMEPIDVIVKMIKTANGYLISDKRHIYHFGYDGVIVTRIGSKGRGPGEYIQITDFEYEVKTNEIIIFSSEVKKLVKFSMDGGLISEEFLVSHGYQIVKVGDNYLQYVCQNGIPDRPDNILIFDNSGNIINSFFDYSDFPIKSMTTMSGFLYARNNNLVRFLNPFNDTIYSFRQDQFIPEYRFDLGVSSLKIEKFSDPYQFLSEYHKFSFLSNLFVENENWFIIKYHDALRRKFAIWLKQEDRFFT